MRFCLTGSACRGPLESSAAVRRRGRTKRWTNRRKSYCIEHIQSGACRVQPTEGRAMVAEIPGAIGRVAEVAPGVKGGTARSAAYCGLAVIILATALNFLDAQVFGMLAQRIKIDLRLTDEQLGFLIGPANIIFYVLVGTPLAPLVDIYPRKYGLAGGITLTGGITALGGLAQNFAQLFCSRMLVGAGGSAHAPGAYSMLADYFPPARLPRAIGFLQRSEEHTSELQSRSDLVCRLLLEKKKINTAQSIAIPDTVLQSILNQDSHVTSINAPISVFAEQAKTAYYSHLAQRTPMLTVNSDG